MRSWNLYVIFASNWMFVVKRKHSWKCYINVTSERRKVLAHRSQCFVLIGTNTKTGRKRYRWRALITTLSFIPASFIILTTCYLSQLRKNKLTSACCYLVPMVPSFGSLYGASTEFLWGVVPLTGGVLG